jgi:hypothetical protein
MTLRTMVCMPASTPVPSARDFPAPAAAHAETSDDAAPAPHGRGSEVHSSRVTIAFPFSQIKTQEPSEELAELAALLVEVIEAVQEACPGAALATLAERAEALRERTA